MTLVPTPSSRFILLLVVILIVSLCLCPAFCFPKEKTKGAGRGRRRAIRKARHIIRGVSSSIGEGVLGSSQEKRGNLGAQELL